MAGILIRSALEAYEGDWEAIHGLCNQLVISKTGQGMVQVLVDREAIGSLGEEVDISVRG